MAKAWNSGTKKPFHLKQVIFRRVVDGCYKHYVVAADDPNGRHVEVARSWAEHEVCSGNARYVEA